MSDTNIIYSGDGLLSTLIKNSYFTSYDSAVGANIYKYHLMALDGTLEFPNNISNELFVSYTSEHLLNFLPYI